jgi:hypothetical protein
MLMVALLDCIPIICIYYKMVSRTLYPLCMQLRERYIHDNFLRIHQVLWHVGFSCAGWDPKDKGKKGIQFVPSHFLTNRDTYIVHIHKSMWKASFLRKSVLHKGKVKGPRKFV